MDTRRQQMMDSLRQWTLGILKRYGVSDDDAKAYTQSERFRGMADCLIDLGVVGITYEAEFENDYGEVVRKGFDKWRSESRGEKQASKPAQPSQLPEQFQPPSNRMGSIPIEWLCDSDKRDIERYIQMKEQLMIAKFRPPLEQLLGCSLPLTPEQQALLRDNWQQHPCILLVPIVEPTPDNQELLKKALVNSLLKLPPEAREEHLSMLLTIIHWGHAFHQVGFIPRELDTHSFFSLGDYWCMLADGTFCKITLKEFPLLCHSVGLVERLIHHSCIHELDGFWDVKAVSDLLLIGKPLPRKAGNYTLYLPKEKRPPRLELNLFPCLSVLSVERIYKQIQPQRVEPRNLAVYEYGMHWNLPVSERAQKGQVATALQFWNQHAPEEWRYEHPQAAKVFRRAIRNAYRVLHREDEEG
jgi:hypothetical protein